MTARIPIRGIGFVDLLRIIGWAGVCTWLALSLVFLILGTLAPSSVTVNGRPAESAVEAATGVLIIAVAGSIASFIFACLSALLLRLFGRFLPLGDISVASPERAERAAASPSAHTGPTANGGTA
jgi:hypothetical protein